MNRNRQKIHQKHDSTTENIQKIDVNLRRPNLDLPQHPIGPLHRLDILPVEELRREQHAASRLVDELRNDRRDEATDDIRIMPTFKRHQLETLVQESDVLKERQTIFDFHFNLPRRRSTSESRADATSTPASSSPVER